MLMMVLAFLTGAVLGAFGVICYALSEAGKDEKNDR